MVKSNFYDMPAGAPTMVIEARGLSKRFGSNDVLRGVDFAVQSGEVHALVGENGAGKSTLVKLLMGNHQPSAGEIRVNGRRVVIRSARAARTLGINAVYQELAVVPSRSIAQNLVLGAEPSRLGFIDLKSVDRRARQLLSEVGEDQLDPDMSLGALGTGQRQVVEIARALGSQSRVLIFDEPTAGLSSSESQRLFAIIARLKTQGMSFIYISHRLDELFLIADRVTVLRDGSRVGTWPIAQLDQRSIVRHMLGRPAESRRSTRSKPGEVVLDVVGLSDDSSFRDVSLCVRSGEVVGLYGLLGSGQRELGRCLAGLHRRSGGTVKVRDRLVRPNRARASRQAGVVFVSDARRTEGVIGPLSIVRNVVSGCLASFARLGLVNRRSVAEAVRIDIEDLAIRPAKPNYVVEQLSGGNQQKVLLARALRQKPTLLVVAEPSQGMDVGAREEIHYLLRQLALDGVPSLVISTDIDETSRVCDRVLVMRRGTVVSELAAADGWASEILSQAAGK